MRADFDIAVVGSGFGGSLLAMVARRLGRSVVLLERGRHPRFAIGESSTPLANLLLEELARRYDLPRLLPLTKWGVWQENYPNVACGLKRGFTFYHHAAGKPWSSRPRRDNELLVAASPHEAIADTHWYRPDFDWLLVREAQALGVEYLDEVQLDGAEMAEDGSRLHGQRRGEEISIRARFIVDASGPRGFLHRALGLVETPFEHFPATQALYAHFTGARRWDELHATAGAPPYPVDDAAVHHVFEGGWVWVLRFNNGLTSAGVAAGSALADELRLSEGATAWSRLMERLPSVREQFADAAPQGPFTHVPQLAFRSGTVAGENWALLPSAAGFVDPLLSTGFPLTLLGVARLAEIIERDWQSPRLAVTLERYSAQTLAELDATARLVGAMHANLGDFEVFTALALLYFAAASFSEAARRLEKPELARSFLLHDDPRLGELLHAAMERATRRMPLDERGGFFAAIHRAIAPINVAGLGDAARRNWYPCRAEDLLAASVRLGVGREKIAELLERSGFFPPLTVS